MSRLQRLFTLTEREAKHLLGVRQRLFGGKDPETIDVAWLESELALDVGIDRLESFGAKFSRLQDTLMDKLIPTMLEAAGERPGTAIDNLDRLERLGLLDDADAWLAMRRLRNRLVHEYIENPEDMIPALRSAYTFSGTMVAFRDALESYCRSREMLSSSR